MLNSNKRRSWILGWVPPWHRKDMDKRSKQQQHSTSSRQKDRLQRSSDTDDLMHYHGNEGVFSYPASDQLMDPGYASPPLSSSSSSTASTSRRNTKASIMDFFQRRKSSSTSSNMIPVTPKQLSSVGPLYTPLTERKSISYSPPILSAAPPPIQPTTTNNQYLLPTAPPTSSSSSPPSLLHLSVNNNNQTSSNITPALSSSSSQQSIAPQVPSQTSTTPLQHRFPFIHCHHEHNNTSTSVATTTQYNDEAHHQQKSHHHHYPSSLFSSTSNQPTSSNQSLSVNKEGPLYEYNMDMEENLSNMDDRKRITLRHDLVRLALDGLFKSPLDPNQEGERQVLQIGCGDGSWCSDCAKMNPNWFILGIDDKNGGPLGSAGKKMMMAGPSASTLPSTTSISTTTTTTAAERTTCGGNFSFIRSTTTLVDSLKQFPDNQFDLVYGRFLALALPPKEYEALVAECWRVCKRGGFVEFTELDMRIYGNPGDSTLINWLNQQVMWSMAKKKLDSRLPRHLQDLFFKSLVEDQQPGKRQLQNNYQVKYNSLPLGVWGGRLGVMFRDDIHDILDALNVATTPDKYGNAMTEEEWLATSDTLDDELEAFMAFMNLYQIYAQKNA
ncbi:uncharacterized protein BX664DRAFT_336170 [Halteromyces radiatus]|uniref:uncharacterized protein n=1 Tax=Halteromyces radiatus TaxID=101107 RepID=UPI00221E78C6|nr:uncharacterized protein BX664DRAFT_336170 [Halteromyces radiatus]KAI8086571.1 hypothetical protein BX664DRAFT_336170 [Halteromyces radiatus]